MEERAQAAKILQNALANPGAGGELGQLLPLINAVAPILKNIFGESSESSLMDEMMKDMFKNAFKAFTEKIYLDMEVSKTLLEKLKKSEVKLEE